MIKVLDCTLRDGGYYNNWDFNRNLVEIYLDAVKAALVDVVEIGFRSPPKPMFVGPFAYSLDDYLESLKIPSSLMIGVMINAKEYLEWPDGSEKLLAQLFQRSEQSPVDVVRVAVNFDSVSTTKGLIAWLKDKGYLVCLNLMQAQGKSGEIYQAAAQQIADWNSVDVLYFADSMGSMDPDDVSSTCMAFRKGWKGDMGFHAHNNKGLALINTLTGIDCEVSWCDGTIQGMGRGAGNTPTEALLMELEHKHQHSGRAEELQPCLEQFEELRREYSWGPNPFYHFAANHKIHPTFVQHLIADVRYEDKQIFPTLQHLARNPSTRFSDNTLRQAVYGGKRKTKGTWDATGWLENRDVLLVGTGPSVGQYIEGILYYIKRNQPSVLFLNVNHYLPNSLADATIIAHESRVLLDAQHYENLQHPLIMPASRIEHLLGDGIKSLKILDYGLDLKEKTFIIGPTGCQLSWTLAAAYALAVIAQAKASQILLIGFDGYAGDDPRQEEMNEMFSSYDRLENRPALVALTPTTYQIRQASIFQPQVSRTDFLVVIPVRYRSSRFPGKPLVEIHGKTMIRWVWEKCVKAVGKENVLVATDDSKILNHCLEYGIHVILTSDKCKTGTDRVCEVARKVDREIYINVQGDEPLIEPSDVATILDTARARRGCIINGMSVIKEEADFRSPNVPKVVVDQHNRLLYMSRAPIPTGKKHEFVRGMRQVTVYAFPRKALLEFGEQSKKQAVEEIEDIEILRFLEMGYEIRMVEVKGTAGSVDTPEDLKRIEALSSMGRPLPGVEAGILCVDGSLGGPGDEGELLIRAPNPQLMLGYWEDPDLTSQVMLRTNGSSWFRTGDNVRQDGDGYLFYIGRTDDIITSSGYRIGPQEVENVLIEHPLVQESAVVGLPDPERGEIVAAFVVLTDASLASDQLADDLQAHVKRMTAPYKYPRRVAFVDELPKTVSGKIQRNLLRRSAPAPAPVGDSEAREADRLVQKKPRERGV